MMPRIAIHSLILTGSLMLASGPAMAALDAHVFRDTDGDGWLNDCPNHDADGDGSFGPADELDGASCTGDDAGSGRRFCAAEDILDVDGDGSMQTLYADINAASSIMTGPGDRVQVHAGTYGDIDGDGTVEQIATIARSGCAQDQDAVATVLHCSSCSGAGDRRLLVAAGDPGARDEVVIDLGHTVATAFATRDANLATIQGFHVIHQDMDTLYEDCNSKYSGTIGRRMAFEAYCP
ncbi:MAG: hypothetical protein O7A07_02200, partial [Acidobacteria bacterium]|nr:hypothetical protein [Acidobacteriota bacterium]